MKKGFTILELLVASMLLGMLMSILTMIFNQSSISWRVGGASVADLDDVSTGISTVHHEADNLYVWNGDSHTLLSLWDENDSGQASADPVKKLRKRAIDAGDEESRVRESEKIRMLNGKVTESTKIGSLGTVGVGSDQTDGGADVYTVNVKSAGPNRKWNDYDDIWSFPDEFE